MEGEFLTTKEAADELGVTTGYIRRMLLDGRITGAKKFGRDNAIPKDEVIRLKNTERKAGRPKGNKK